MVVVEVAADPQLAPIFGGADEGIPPADVEGFDAACRKAGIKHDMKVYEGAPHSFFDRRHKDFAAASEDAWNRVLDFIERHR